MRWNGSVFAGRGIVRAFNALRTRDCYVGLTGAKGGPHMGASRREGGELMLAFLKQPPPAVETPTLDPKEAPREPRPMRGPVDYDAMRRRIMARFTKTIAYLAE